MGTWVPAARDGGGRPIERPAAHALCLCVPNARVTFADARWRRSPLPFDPLLSPYLRPSPLHTHTQVILETLDANVRRGRAVAERGHALLLAWCASQRDVEVVRKVLAQVCLANRCSGAAGGIVKGGGSFKRGGGGGFNGDSSSGSDGDADGGDDGGGGGAGPATVVVLCQRSKVKMEAAVLRELPAEARYGTRIVFRQGSPLLPSDLALVSAAAARAVLIVSDQSRPAREADAQSLRAAILVDELGGGRGGGGGGSVGGSGGGGSSGSGGGSVIAGAAPAAAAATGRSGSTPAAGSLSDGASGAPGAPTAAAAAAAAAAMTMARSSFADLFDAPPPPAGAVGAGAAPPPGQDHSSSQDRSAGPRIVVQIKTADALPLVKYACSSRVVALPTGPINAARVRMWSEDLGWSGKAC